MTTLFYRYPRLLILTLLLILLGGVSSYLILPRLEDPELTFRFASIKVRFPGADANRIETLITEKIENELAEVDEIKILTSITSLGITDIQMELKDHVIEVDSVWSRIRDKVDNVVLPAQATQPEFKIIAAKANALILALVWNKETPPNHSILRRKAKELKNILNGVFGTELVEMYGEQVEEIRVTPTLKTLESLKLTIEEISALIEKSDDKSPVGTLRSSQTEILLETKSELDSIERIKNIPIKVGNSGEVIRLGEIATVEKTIQTPLADLALVGGRPAVALGIKTISSQRSDLWLAQVQKILNEYQRELPQDLTLETLFDQNVYTEGRIHSLFKNLIQGLLLILFVIFFMMDWKSAITISFTLPLASLMVLAGMNFMGIPIHQMSVTGLIISLGLLVDNAIVVIDELQEQLVHQENNPSGALSETIKHLFTPLVGSTLTTTFSFMPMAIMPGSIGEFINPIGISVILSLFSSLFLSLTVIPTLHTFFFIGLKKLFSFRSSEASSASLSKTLYFKLLHFFFSHPILTIFFSLAPVLFGFYKAAELKEQFFPPSDRDQIQIEVELSSVNSQEATKSLVLQINEVLKAEPQIRQFHWFIGENAPIFYYNLPFGKENLPFYAHSLVQLKSWKNSQTLVQNLQKSLDERFPSAKILVRLLEQGPLIEAPIEIRGYGPDVEVLQKWGDDVRKELFQIPNVIHTRASLNETLPKLEFHLDEEKVRLAGLDYASVSSQISFLMEGKQGGSLLETTEDLSVRVTIPEEEKRNTNQLLSLNLLSTLPEKNQKTRIPLSSLGEIKLVPTSSTIYRRNRDRYNTVQAYIKAGVLPSEVLNELKSRLEKKEITLPHGYRFEYGGEEEGKGEAVGHLISTVGILLFLMIATLVLSVQSFTVAFLITFIALCSIFLGIGTLWLFNYPFGFMAILGCMGLIGVSVNDSLVIIAGIKREEALFYYASEVEQVCTAVVKGSRHVFATSITTVAGFLPILFDHGSFWPPMVLPIAGGILGATLLALYFLPSAYLLLKKWSSLFISTSPKQDLGKPTDSPLKEPIKQKEQKNKTLV